jgi:hypothetical protein
MPLRETPTACPCCITQAENVLAEMSNWRLDDRSNRVNYRLLVEFFCGERSSDDVID